MLMKNNCRRFFWGTVAETGGETNKGDGGAHYGTTVIGITVAGVETSEEVSGVYGDGTNEIGSGGAAEAGNLIERVFAVK
jgi:hypothetical protein